MTVEDRETLHILRGWLEDHLSETNHIPSMLPEGTTIEDCVRALRVVEAELQLDFRFGPLADELQACQEEHARLKKGLANALDNAEAWHSKYIRCRDALLALLDLDTDADGGIGDAMTIARKALLHERTDSDEDAWLHSEQLKALVAVERFVVEIEAEFWKTPGIAYTVAIQNVLKRWRADMVKP